MATKPRLLIQGSSWTVGAYKPSTVPNSDDLVPGGLAELLSESYDVTNISVGDDFNLGSVHRLREHLTSGCEYDQLLICQNDPLKDLLVLRSSDTQWSRNFKFGMDHLLLHKTKTISQLIEYLLNQFYKQIAALKLPTLLFAGPSQVLADLATSHGLRVIEQSWTQILVPEFTGSYIETSSELVYAGDIVKRLFPESAQTVKTELCDYADQINDLLNTWKTHDSLFARHHPTALGNRKFYEHIRELI